MRNSPRNSDLLQEKSLHFARQSVAYSTTYRLRAYSSSEHATHPPMIRLVLDRVRPQGISDRFQI